MSDSDDSYGPALPPGLKQSQIDSKSDSEEFGPVLSTAAKPQTSQPSIGPILPPGVKLQTSHTSDSDSDSSSSESNTDRRKRKKKKSSEKQSSRKKRKHRHSSSDSSSNSSDSESDSRSKHKRKFTDSDRKSKTSNIIGPVIPAALHQSEESKRIGAIGPSLPPGFSSTSQAANNDSGDDDDDDYGIGPSIGLKANAADLSAAQEFESRSEKMREKLTGKPEDKAMPQQRESWMTDLPQDMGARFGLGPRQFRKGEAAEIDSSWTETPQDKEKKKESKKKKQDKNSYIRSEAEMQAAKEIEAYNKKHRKESLLEMHKKEMKKKKKKEKKKNKGKDKPKERVAFDRERDLKVNQLDEAQKRAFIKRSQELGSRFKSGGAGTSFL